MTKQRVPINMRDQSSYIFEVTIDSSQLVYLLKQHNLKLYINTMCL